MKKLFSLLTLLLLLCTSAWGAASTSSDGKYATGTTTFSEIGSISNTTNYWYNGIKFYANASGTASTGNSTWASSVSYPSYISNITSGNKWGTNGQKTYSMSGLACNRYALGIHVNEACTITVVVNRNLASDTDEAGISASIDATAYGTGWTTSNYATAGTSLTVTSARADKTNYPGKYTLTIPVTAGDLTDGEAVVKMFNSSSGTGAGKLFCWESITVTAAPTYSVTINPNGGSYASTPDGWSLTDGKYTKSGLSGSFDVPDGLAYLGYDLNGWKDNHSNDITLPITLSKDTTLVAQWAAHATSSDATLSALSVVGCTLNETFDPATTAYTVNLPFYASMPAVGDVTATKNDSYAADPEVSISGNVITVACEAEDGTTTKTYTITVTIADVPTASSSINIEQLILDNSKSYDIGSALDAAHIAYVGKDALDSLLMGTSDKNKTDCNEAYLGLKFKLTTSKVTIIVPSSQSLNVKFGAITDGSNLTVSVNGAAAATPSLTNNVYALAASEGAKEVVFALGGAKTVVFKQIMINQAIATVRPFKIESITATNGTASTDLTKYAKGETVTVNYTPNSGYQLGSISVSGYNSNGVATSVTVSNTNEFTMPGSPVNITATFIPVSVSGTISDCGWNTFSSPYPLDLTQVVTNGTVYYASESNGSTVTLEGAPSQVVPAGEGLMVKGTAGETFTIKTSSDAGTAISGNLLKGQTITGDVSATNHYVFGYVTDTPSTYGFYALTATTEVQAGKAYLEYPAAMAPSFLRIVEGEQSATGVENIEANDKAVKFIENGQLYILRDGVVYDTVGRVIRK